MSEEIVVEKERLYFSYPEEMKLKLTEIAKAEGRSLENLLKTVINSHIEEVKNGNKNESL